jgi:hypothetical protein
MRGGEKQLIVEIGSYQRAEQVGFRGWICFEKNIAFESLDGQIIVIGKLE